MRARAATDDAGRGASIIESTCSDIRRLEPPNVRMRYPVHARATPRTPPNTYCTRISRRVRCVVNRPETTKVDDAVVVARAIPLSPTRALDRQRTFIMVRNA